MSEQHYANHRRFDPRFHFFAFPILAINVLVAIYFFVREIGRAYAWMAVWNVIVAFAIVMVAYLVRTYATALQDRIIRLEERVRLERVLPADLRERIDELTTRQLIGLRFCDDAEVADMTRAVLSGELRGAGSIKKRITRWRPDHLRV